MSLNFKKVNDNLLSEKEILYLSILQRMDGFCFCIYNLGKKQIAYLSDYSANKTSLINTFEKILSEDNLLKLNFEKVKITLYNSVYTLSPNDFFDKEIAREQLSLTNSLLDSETIGFEQIQNSGTTVIYSKMDDVLTVISDRFSKISITHFQSNFISQFIKHSKENNDDIGFYIHKFEKQLDILVVKNNNLLLSNSFEISSKNDFIYYILFVFEQLELDRNTTKTYLLGDILKNDESYNLVKEFVKKIHLIQNHKYNFEINPELKSITKKYFAILNSALCE